MNPDLLWLTFMLAAMMLWLEALRARERALRMARSLCGRDDVQLLDETVGLSALRLRRAHGHLQLQRRYSFEVSLDGRDRHRGHLWLAGPRLLTASTPWQNVEPAFAPIDITSRTPQRQLPPGPGVH